ncbi:hypothetical protein DX130_21395 [Paenibacillus paeoniae]|uniref:Uncharacterized protein n=1 Tax=Paenibacillus paeoniae TaxID=2292705 RepID=A0A371P6P0_9BACL|nr:hypothetical protein DX130_21395 [Paenibacillus paeoniae]
MNYSFIPIIFVTIYLDLNILNVNKYDSTDTKTDTFHNTSARLATSSEYKLELSHEDIQKGVQLKEHVLAELNQSSFSSFTPDQKISLVSNEEGFQFKG